MAAVAKQSGKSVTVIPASCPPRQQAPAAVSALKKVAAYARVSTDHAEQQASYEAQIRYYTAYIQGRADWQFVSMYSDEGVSGTSTKRREGFRQMIADALAGKIDLILTKSVSRFARNTVDSLTAIRTLKAQGVECYFEKENIWTLDAKGELLITIMSSLAQEESRSISENVTWGMRKNFQNGKAFIPFKHFLGYDRGPNGEFVLNPVQAETVRQIYRLYLEGFSFYAIATRLTAQGVSTPCGRAVWNGSTIHNILKNEKYRGDALLQKRYSQDFLTKKMIVNRGEVPQYYVEDAHEAIIDPQTFEMVQAELLRRAGLAGKYSGGHIFSSKLQCGDCGGWYGPVVWHPGGQYRRVVWRCRNKYKRSGPDRCATPHVTEEMVRAAFVRALNHLAAQKTARTAPQPDPGAVSGALFVTAEQEELTHALHTLAAQMQSAAQERAHTQDCRAEYDRLAAQYAAVKARYDANAKILSGRAAKQAKAERVWAYLNRLEAPVEIFEEEWWAALVDHAVICATGEICFVLQEGTEISG